MKALLEEKRKIGVDQLSRDSDERMQMEADIYNATMKLETVVNENEKFGKVNYFWWFKVSLFKFFLPGKNCFYDNTYTASKYTTLKSPIEYKCVYRCLLL